MCEMLDVQSLLHIQVRRLSLGERMKMELIAAFHHNPKVIFLDEPTIAFLPFWFVNSRSGDVLVSGLWDANNMPMSIYPRVVRRLSEIFSTSSRAAMYCR